MKKEVIGDLDDFLKDFKDCNPSDLDETIIN